MKKFIVNVKEDREYIIYANNVSFSETNGLIFTVTEIKSTGLLGVSSFDEVLTAYFEKGEYSYFYEVNEFKVD